MSLLFIVILYLTLRQTFANYQKQVVDLVDSIQAIAQGEEGLRIDTLEKDQELLLIAETTMICWIDWKRISMIFTS